MKQGQKYIKICTGSFGHINFPFKMWVLMKITTFTVENNFDKFNITIGVKKMQIY